MLANPIHHFSLINCNTCEQHSKQWLHKVSDFELRINSLNFAETDDLFTREYLKNKLHILNRKILVFNPSDGFAYEAISKLIQQLNDEISTAERNVNHNTYIAGLK